MTSATEEGDPRVHRWLVRPAIAGRGEILYGPDPYRPGAIVLFAPPDVMVRSEDGMTREGWRQVYWAANSGRTPLIDQDRPDSVEQVSIAQVVEEVADRCPEYLDWVANIVEREFRFDLARMRARDLEDRLHPGAQEAWEQMNTLVTAADDAFDRACERIGGMRSWSLTPDRFTHLRASYSLPLYAKWAESESERRARPRLWVVPDPVADHRTDDDEEDRRRRSALE